MLLKLENADLFNCLLIYLLAIFILFICFIYFVVIGRSSSETVEKGLLNNLPIVLKKLNEAYSEEMTKAVLKEAKLLNHVRHEISSRCLLFLVIEPQ